jgi:hypothetical protein
MGFQLANGLGKVKDSPSKADIRAFLNEVNAKDVLYGAAWLSTETGLCLEWNGDGRLVYVVSVAAPPRHLLGVTRSRALTLFFALVEGDVGRLERCSWQRGRGYAATPEKLAEAAAWRLLSDREFYASLGAEQQDARCRREGCSRGRVKHSVLCRVHHFESIHGRPSPLHD